MDDVRWKRNFLACAVGACVSFIIGIFLFDDTGVANSLMTGAFVFLLFSAFDYAAAHHARTSGRE